MSGTKKSEYDMAQEVRASNILLEEMRGHFQLVMEGLGSLTGKVDGLEVKVTGLEHRMDQFELAMLEYNLITQEHRREMQRHNQVMEVLRKDVNRHDDDIVTLKTAVGIKA
jgi:hypothetical protein